MEENNSARESAKDRVVKILKRKLDSNIKNEDWYTASQTYKTLLNRLKQLDQTSEAIALCSSGCLRLLPTSSENAAWELANSMIDIAENSQIHPASFENSLVPHIEAILSNEDALTKSPNQVMEYLSHVNRWQFSVVKNLGHAPLNAVVGTAYQKLKLYEESMKSLIRTSEFDRLSEVMIEWAMEGNKTAGDEIDVYLARVVLEMLAIGAPADGVRIVYLLFARAFLLSPPMLSKDAPESERAMTPLSNFSWYIILVVEKKQPAFFKKLKTTYLKSLKRDPHLLDLMGTIGRNELNLGLSSSSGTGSMSDLMGMIGSFADAFQQ